MPDLHKMITRYPPGSIKELWSISFPLMISSLASLLMIFVDRCFLSHYSVDALNASVNAGTLAWAYLGGTAMIAESSGIFVAQYNGAKRTQELAKPVWQMIWFSAFSFVIFFALYLWIGPLFFRSSPFAELELQYFGILMLFGPFYPFMHALSGFYIARGKTKFLIILAIIANFINILLDWLFIFGTPTLIPEMGIKGAAIATSIGSVFQAGVIFYMFLLKRNRKLYKTSYWKLDKQLFLKCLRVGVPQGLFYSLEILGWVVFFKMMTSLGTEYLTISSICQSLLILLSFFNEGLSKGVSAIAGNFIGSQNYDNIKKLLRSGIKLLLIFSLALSFVLFFQSNRIIQMLLPETLKGASVSLQNVDYQVVYQTLKICLVCVFGYIFFEGIRWILSGVLAAAGDTFFLLISGSVSIWVFFLLPVYFLVIKMQAGILTAWFLSSSYACILSIMYYLRYTQGKWKQIRLSDPAKTQEDSLTK